MVNLWIIVGEANAGKSTAIRALTGVRDDDIFTLDTVAGVLIPNMLIVSSALQERYKKSQPQDFVNYVMHGITMPGEKEKQNNQQQIDNVLICLRIQQVKNRPCANDYIRVFVQAGWNMSAPIVHLHTQNLQYRAPLCIQHLMSPGRPDNASNKIAHAIRQVWQWL